MAGEASSIKTNRELYLFVAQVQRKARAKKRPLEEYLRALFKLGAQHRELDVLPVSLFAEVLERAVDEEAPALDVIPPQEVAALRGYAGWENKILRQIVDLRQMRDTGMDQDPHRTMGLKAPSGAPWFNFTTGGYLECAANGSFDGWEPDDDTDRELVPGPVGVLLPDGTLGSAAPEDLERPVDARPTLSWDDFTQFLWNGQAYE